jgi:lipoprotein NlpI
MMLQESDRSDGKMLGGLLVFGAIVLGTMVWITLDPRSQHASYPQGIANRVENAIQKGDTDGVLKELNQAIIDSPKKSVLYLYRGSLLFRTGKVRESLTDFDKVIELDPESKPHLWQRGIALYYAGEFEKGKEQFEVHKSVNPNDVENAFWHFLCAAKLDGVESAQKHVLLSGFDQREPLMEVQKMIVGELTVADVLAVTERGNDSTKFYGYLYLGLYEDVKGNKQVSEDYLKKCVAVEYPGYMQDVAKLHLQALRKEGGKESPPANK